MRANAIGTSISTARGSGNPRRTTANRTRRSPTLFDSVYVSFYKGIGAIAGAMLCGSQPMIDEATHLAAPSRRQPDGALSVCERRGSRVRSAHHARCRSIAKPRAGSAKIVAAQPGTLRVQPTPPPTNMFHAYLCIAPEMLADTRQTIAREQGVWTMLAHVADRHRRRREMGNQHRRRDPQRSAQNAPKPHSKHCSPLPSPRAVGDPSSTRVYCVVNDPAVDVSTRRSGPPTLICSVSVGNVTRIRRVAACRSGRPLAVCTH